jgi:hypothetical protein
VIVLKRLIAASSGSFARRQPRSNRATGELLLSNSSSPDDQLAVVGLPRFISSSRPQISFDFVDTAPSATPFQTRMMLKVRGGGRRTFRL